VSVPDGGTGEGRVPSRARAAPGAPDGEARRWTRLVALPLGLQLVLALLAQHGRPFLDDEVGTWRLSGEGLHSLLTHFEEWQTQPAYLLLARLSALLLGRGELALRLPALLAGLGLTGGIFLLGRRLVDARAGFVAACLTALHPYLLFYSQMARGYSLAMALTVLSLLCVQRLASGVGGQGTLALGVLARAGSVYAHLGACATLPAEVLLALQAARSAQVSPGWRPLVRPLARALSPVLLGGLLAIALYLPLLPDMRAFRERWTGQELGGFTPWVLPLVARVYGGGTLVGMGLLFALGSAGLVFLLRDRARRITGLALAAWCLGLPLFYAGLDTACYPWAFARFLLPALPGGLLVAGIGLSALLGRLRGAGAAGATGPCLGAVALVAGLAYGQLVPLALGPKDLAWSRFLDELATQGPRTLVLAPVRFHAAEPYLQRLAGSEVEVLRVEDMTRLLRAQGPARLLARPLTVLQDVVPVEALAGPFRLTPLGASTRLDLVTPPGDARAALEALRGLARAQIACLEPREGRPFEGPWVYWRLDLRHEHLALASRSHAAAHALLAATDALLGQEDEARVEERRARELREAFPLPGQVTSRF